MASYAQSTDVFDYDVAEIEVTIDNEAWHDTLINRKKRYDKLKDNQ